MSKINFANKETFRQSGLAEKHKMTADNVNEIKDSVNWLYDNQPQNTSDLTNDSDFQNGTQVQAVLPTKTSDLTNDSDFQNGTQLQTAINTALSSVFKVKGSVANFAALPANGNTVGDVWNTIDTGMNYVWNGTVWDALGTTVNLSNFYTKSEVNGLISQVQSLIPIRFVALGDISAINANIRLNVGSFEVHLINIDGQYAGLIIETSKNFCGATMSVFTFGNNTSIRGGVSINNTIIHDLMPNLNGKRISLNSQDVFKGYISILDKELYEISVHLGNLGRYAFIWIDKII
jgi:hypothetical protein